MKHSSAIGLALVILLMPVMAHATTDTFAPTVDGEAARAGVSETWSTIRNSGGNGSDYTGGTGWIYYLEKSTNYTNMYRGLYSFDTSSIPDDAIIDSWSLNLVGSTGVSPSNTIGADTSQSDIVIVTTTLSSTTTLTNSDYQGVGTVEAGRFAYASWVNDNATFNALDGSDMDAINVTGNTSLALRSGADFDNDDAGLGNGVLRLYTIKADSAGGTDPYLEVTYHLPASSSSSSSSSSSAATSGSLILFHSACTAFDTEGSGATNNCTAWDTSIEIEAVNTMQTQFSATIFAGIVLLIRWLIGIAFMCGLAWFLFHLLTLYKPRKK